MSMGMVYTGSLKATTTTPVTHRFVVYCILIFRICQIEVLGCCLTFTRIGDFLVSCRTTVYSFISLYVWGWYLKESKCNQILALLRKISIAQLNHRRRNLPSSTAVVQFKFNTMINMMDDIFLFSFPFTLDNVSFPLNQ